MAEKTTVAFRVDESVKQEWEEAADDPEYDSLSHLIRLAVQREIADTETPPPGAQTATDMEGDGEALQSLNRIERVVEDLQDEIEAVGRESRAEELYDLEQVLLEVLPTVEQTTIQDLKDYSPASIDEDDPSYDPEGETPETIAARIGADEQVVSNALNQLSDNTSQVRRSEIAFDHQPRYMRVE